MKFGLYLPNYGDGLSVRGLAELAAEAETAGWDGFFLWDHILVSKTGKLNVLDPWVALTAMALSTEYLRLGTSVTPLARRRPWKLARETTSLDQTSNGRLILGTGLGEPPEAEFGVFGEPVAAAQRAGLLDEGLDILTGLWSGKPFRYEGKHYRIEEKVIFRPTPIQQPRIPIWVGGFWPNRPPYRRAARWDGIIPLKHQGWIEPQDLEAILSFVLPLRSQPQPPDVAVIDTRSHLGAGSKADKRLARLEAAGATWWLSSLYRERNALEDLRASIRQGPPGF